MIDRTRKYYSSITTDDLCDCDYCRNFRMQIASAYPDLTSYLNTLGIDISKPFEVLLPLEEGISDDISKNGSDDTHSCSRDLMEYPFAMYVVFSSCDESFTDRIGDVDIWITTSHPDTGIEGEDHFVLAFGPVFLKKLLPCD